MQISKYSTKVTKRRRMLHGFKTKTVVYRSIRLQTDKSGDPGHWLRDINVVVYRNIPLQMQVNVYKRLRAMYRAMELRIV